LRSLNWQSTKSILSHLKEMQAQLNQIQKIVQDGQHLATIGVNVVGDVNDALERVTGMDHDGDGMVRQ
jgi:hypothetical protein